MSISIACGNRSGSSSSSSNRSRVLSSVRGSDLQFRKSSRCSFDTWFHSPSPPPSQNERNTFRHDTKPPKLGPETLFDWRSLFCRAGCGTNQVGCRLVTISWVPESNMAPNRTSLYALGSNMAPNHQSLWDLRSYMAPNLFIRL